ncbi:hypothetical protein IPZ58_09580 [Streptomyces roseoverticillatus]|uniref:hypothetical protein n=1 Tax=Streptomyces roseoverticillatus TaxID=66429 RepID=UPI001F22C0BE|nr:hypothetical protein [Streptomyces roseoverticillatus]MCF3101832.1 hypothetical protein [Streptomyces roseoverticillatus]
MHELTEERLLAMWESGSGQGPCVRTLLLATAAAPSGDPVPDRTLGGIHALLLGLGERSFGERFPCGAECPACAEPLDVTVETAELRPAEPPALSPRTGRLRIAGHEVTYRALTLRDLLAVDPGSPDARRALVSRCVLRTVPASRPLPDAVLEAVAGRLAELDPGADTRLDLTCPHCGHTWPAAFDVAEHLWAAVEAYAHRFLHDVHTLARAYGWAESDVLAVSPARRRFYLEAAG